jgi:hypothetical protein
MKKIKLKDSSMQVLSLKEGKCHKSETLSKLSAQKIQALQNNDTKTANLIQKIINLLEGKK